MKRPEHGSHEGFRGHERRNVPTSWRSKTGLEPPLFARLTRENRRLVIAPPVWYDRLVQICFIGGLIFGYLGLSHNRLIPPDFFEWSQYVGFAVAIAGVLAMVSNERMTCNLTHRTYSRLEGQGIFRKIVNGSLQELEALVLMATPTPYPTDVGRAVDYRLVLYWKGHKEPIFVVEFHRAPWPSHMPINGNAGFLYQQGVQLSKVLGVPFVDRSMVPAPVPLPFI